MLHMPMRTLAVSAALALAVVLIAAPLGGVAHAAGPMHGTMMYDDMGSAHFDPNELPDEVVRDNGDKCDWWGYKLVRGRYVRYHHPCRYGDQDVDYSPSYRAEFQSAALVQLTASDVTTSDVEAAATEQGAPAEPEMSTEEVAPAEAAEEVEAVDEEPAEQADIIDTAAAASEFATLLAAIGAADLDDMLRDVGPFTVFAPTDAAFAALAGDALVELLEAPSGELIQIVLYHVIPGSLMAGDLSDGMEVVTLQGTPLTITVDGDSIMVDGANIVTADIETSNGVIHVIDAVLALPAE